MRIPFEQLKAEFKRVLLPLGFNEDKADTCALSFAQNSLDGVYTHGLNRFPAFVHCVKIGIVKPEATPVCIDSMGAIERWDGRLGSGILNASACMARAIELADHNNIGCVAIRNTNHWMRGGTYGWQAADAGYIGICFTNTIANVSPWGGLDPRLGNNPLIIAVPRKNGNIVLDMAVSQYSYGKLHQHKANHETLPLPGGYDKAGNLTADPAAIIESQRALPIGFWKGSGLSMMLATILSKGRSTEQVTALGKDQGVSQVFICIKPDNDAHTAALIEGIINYTKSGEAEAGKQVQYPGEGTWKTRIDNQKNGIPVDIDIWEQVLAM